MKELIAAGMSPDQALEIYRGSVLAVRVRSIGEAAGLEINSKGTGFVRAAPAHAEKREGPAMSASEHFETRSKKGRGHGAGDPSI